MSRTIAVHVRYESLHISLPSSAKQREMTNSALSEERELLRLIFLKCYFKFIAGVPDSEGKILIHFLIDVVFGVAVVAS